MFIFAVIISLIFTAYTGSIRTMNNTDSQADISRMASITMERMTEDLESILISTWIEPDDTVNSPVISGRFLGEHDEIDGMSADRIRFLSTARVIFDEQRLKGGGVEISYYLKQDEEQQGLILYRSETSTFEPPPEQWTGGLEVCRGIKSLEITYLNGEGETVEEWDSTSLETNPFLPRVVSIILSFWGRTGEEESIYPFRTSVVLPLARGHYENIP